VRQGVSLTAIVEFVANFYVFPLLVEMIVIPVLMAVYAMQAVAGTKAEYATVKKLLDGTAIAFGVVLVAYAVVRTASDAANLASSQTLMEFALPILLTAGFLPFVYGVARYSRFDHARRVRNLRT
jgi:hypothetical protein